MTIAHNKKLPVGPFDPPLQWFWDGHDQNSGGVADLTKPDTKLLEWGILVHTGMTFTVSIPRKSVIVSILGEAKRLPMGPNLPGTDWEGCPDPASGLGGDCAISYCRWDGLPTIDDRRPDIRIVGWYFHNWSNDYHVDARIRVFYYHCS